MNQNHMINEVMEDGNALALEILPFIKSSETQFTSDEDRIVWWAAFLGAINGMAAASVGIETLQAIQKTTLGIVEQVVHQHKH